MKIGVNTYIWADTFDSTSFHLLPRIRAAGFDGIEIPILSPSSFDADAIRAALAHEGLASTAVAIVPAGSGLNSPDPSARTAAVRHLRECIVKARDLGATLLCGPMYSPVGYFTGTRRTRDEWNWTVESWQQLSRDVLAAGIEIAIEPLNRFETYFLNTIDDAVRLCAEIDCPSIGILFDTFHANIEEKSVAAALELAAPHLKHVHACENDRGIPGSGHIPWDDVFSTLETIGYDRWLTIESFGFSLGALSAAAAIWRDLASTPEAIAFEGLKFLKARVGERSGGRP